MIAMAGVPTIYPTETLLGTLFVNGLSEGDSEPFRYEHSDRKASGCASPTTRELLCGTRARGTRAYEPFSGWPAERRKPTPPPR